MAELAGVLSSINNERSATYVAEQNTTQVTFNEKIHKEESEFSQSQNVTSSLIKSHWDTKKISSSTTPSSLANAKTSFLQSIITSPGASSDLALQGRNNSEAFMHKEDLIIYNTLQSCQCQD